MFVHLAHITHARAAPRLCASISFFICLPRCASRIRLSAFYRRQNGGDNGGAALAMPRKIAPWRQHGSCASQAAAADARGHQAGVGFQQNVLTRAQRIARAYLTWRSRAS